MGSDPITRINSWALMSRLHSYTFVAASAIVLLAAIVLGYGATLHEGLWFDDHWHFQELRRIGWSPRALLDAGTIDTRRFIDIWWQDTPARFQYARPFAMSFMKSVYGLTGWSVPGQHAANILLHLIAACLVLWSQ